MVNLQQIRQDIISGKSKTVFRSQNTKWWTHLFKDVKDIQEEGKKAFQEQHDQLIRLHKQGKKFKMSGTQEEQLEKARVAIMTGAVKVDKFGSPLDEIDSRFWFDNHVADSGAAERFGKYGFNALVVAHAQNCGDLRGSHWDVYNNAIENAMSLDKAIQDSKENIKKESKTKKGKK